MSSPAGPELFDHAIAGVRKRLRRAPTAPQMMSAIGWGLGELDRAFDHTPAATLATVACRDGCAFCCQVPVDVQAHEVFFAAEHIQLHFSADQLQDALNRLEAHRARIGNLLPGERDFSRNPCSLLTAAGSCSIYAGRPSACRSHHTSDSSACAAHVENPRLPIDQAYVPALRARMFSVMLGIDEAFESAGYDDRAYDFGSALHEALTNPLCLSAWLDHRAAFPDSCLADPEP